MCEAVMPCLLALFDNLDLDLKYCIFLAEENDTDIFFIEVTMIYFYSLTFIALHPSHHLEGSYVLSTTQEIVSC